MAKIIVSTGRGGTGKTTFAALAARYLESPFLLIDLDPDQNLADMLGVCRRTSYHDEYSCHSPITVL